MKARSNVASTKAIAVTERVSFDNSGGLRSRSLSGCRYACLIVDEFSACWAVTLKSITQMRTTVPHILEVSLQ
jgi:hypothetical protein